MISIAEEIPVPSPRELVWAVISDPAQVVACVSGAELGDAHDDGSFDGKLLIKFGAVRVRFGARVSLDLAPDEFEGRLSARGKDGQAATRFTATATFRVLDGSTPGTSRVVVAGEVELSGKLAGLVEAGAGAVVARMTNEFATALVARCASTESTAADAPSALDVPQPSGQARSRARLGARLRVWWQRLWHRPRAAVPRSEPRAAAEPPVVGLPEDGGW